MSSALSEEQTDWFVERYGQRFVRVQENADRPSRRQRRAAARTRTRRREPLTVFGVDATVTFPCGHIHAYEAGQLLPTACPDCGAC